MVKRADVDDERHTPERDGKEHADPEHHRTAVGPAVALASGQRPHRMTPVASSVRAPIGTNGIPNSKDSRTVTDADPPAVEHGTWVTWSTATGVADPTVAVTVAAEWPSASARAPSLAAACNESWVLYAQPNSMIPITSMRRNGRTTANSTSAAPRSADPSCTSPCRVGDDTAGGLRSAGDARDGGPGVVEQTRDRSPERAEGHDDDEGDERDEQRSLDHGRTALAGRVGLAEGDQSDDDRTEHVHDGLLG